LDADTVLESENYIARTVEELYKAAGVAAVCGTVLPLRHRDRHAWSQREQVRTFMRSFPGPSLLADNWWRDFLTGLTNLYREVLNLQRPNPLLRHNHHPVRRRSGLQTKVCRGVFRPFRSAPW